jgi:7-carboxy-7-deazaguanine synthase
MSVPSVTLAAAGTALRVTEIFHSIQGESRPMGLPTVFIRLTGCPLRCKWCDTAYAFHGGQRHAIAEIVAEVGRYATRHVCVTGGEPLAQPGCIDLLRALCDAGFAVSLETSGALDIAEVDRRVTVVLDVKAPGSGEVARNRLTNLPLLKATDQVKIVIADRADYDWARDFLAQHALAERCEVLLSPVWGSLEARTLAEWILADRLSVRFQLQLHKLLWGDAPGH